MSVISIDHLQFGYQRRTPILKELSMAVPRGSIYGFLGANGAGKSTTIRNILGLLRPQSGKVSVFDQEIFSAPPQLFHRIGSLIESPSLYPQLSAKGNLLLACKYLGVSPKKIDALLETVGLLAHRDKAAKKYSTGMKQRLGLAMALIHDPELLILDEPTNGLDPNGITEMRRIISRLREEGKTIMLSSHLLSEVERIATHVGILKGGAMIFEGTLAELDELKSAQQEVQIKTNQPAQAKILLSNFSIVPEAGNILRINISHKHDIARIVKILVEGGLEVYEVSPLKSDLEKMFMDLTNK